MIFPNPHIYNEDYNFIMSDNRDRDEWLWDLSLPSYIRPLVRSAAQT